MTKPVYNVEVYNINTPMEGDVWRMAVGIDKPYGIPVVPITLGPADNTDMSAAVIAASKILAALYGLDVHPNEFTLAKYTAFWHGIRRESVEPLIDEDGRVSHADALRLRGLDPSKAAEARIIVIKDGIRRAKELLTEHAEHDEYEFDCRIDEAAKALDEAMEI